MIRACRLSPANGWLIDSSKLVHVAPHPHNPRLAIQVRLGWPGLTLAEKAKTCEERFPSPADWSEAHVGPVCFCVPAS